MELRPSGKWICRDRSLEWGGRTKIMGVLNVTPDSFFDGGQYLDLDAALARGRALCEAGADIVDIGGESSRPGSHPVSEEEELARVVPVVSALSRELPALLSVDTTKPVVARAALEAGAHIVNDISAGRGSSAMFDLAREYRAGLVLMHMQGSPRTMQANPAYENVAQEVIDFLTERVASADAG